jgi:hypothetical protein
VTKTKCECKTKKQLIASIRSMCIEHTHSDIERKLFWKFAKIRTSPEALLGDQGDENIIYDALRLLEWYIRTNGFGL